MRWRLDDGQIEVVDERVAECLRRMTPAQRAAKMQDSQNLIRQMIHVRLRADHPDWSERQISDAIAWRMLGETGRAAIATTSPNGQTS